MLLQIDVHRYTVDIALANLLLVLQQAFQTLETGRLDFVVEQSPDQGFRLVEQGLVCLDWWILFSSFFVCIHCSILSLLPWEPTGPYDRPKRFSPI